MATLLPSHVAVSTRYINNFHTSKCSERTEWFAIAEAEDPSKHGIVEILTEDDREDIKQRHHAAGVVHVPRWSP